MYLPDAFLCVDLETCHFLLITAACGKAVCTQHNARAGTESTATENSTAENAEKLRKSSGKSQISLLESRWEF